MQLEVCRTRSLLHASSSDYKHSSALRLKILSGSLTVRAFFQPGGRFTHGASLALLHRAAPPASPPLPAGAQWFAPVGAPLPSLSDPQSELQPGNREDAEPHRSSPPHRCPLSARVRRSTESSCLLLLVRFSSLRARQVYFRRWCLSTLSPLSSSCRCEYPARLRVFSFLKHLQIVLNLHVALLFVNIMVLLFGFIVFKKNLVSL